MATNKSTETYQDKYSTDVKLALGLTREEDKNRVLAIMQKNQSDGHENFIWYKSKKLDAQDQENNYDEANHNYTKKKGVDMTDFLTAVRGTPTAIDLPVYLNKDEFKKTAIELDGHVVITQTAGINTKTMKKILTPLKEYCVDGTYQQPKKDGTSTAITITNDQKFGDKTKSFYDNENAFFEMLAAMEEFSTGAAGDFTANLLYGTKVNGVLKNYDRASNKDYITTEDFESKQGKKYSVKKFDIAEMINIREFDGVFGKTTGTICGVISQCMGYDTRGAADPESDYNTDERAYFYNLTLHDAAEIVDEQGIFVFEFDGTLGKKTVQTKEVVVA